MRKTKIVATIGPATRSDEKIDQLVRAGVDVVRLNFSHGTAAEHAAAVTAVRRAAQHHERSVAILQDLQGPKIRTGALKDDKPVVLTAGQALIITTEACVGTADCISTSYEALPDDVKRGDRILLSDGLIALQVVSSAGTQVITQVVNGGILKAHQGINLPGVALSAPAVTEKDLQDLQFGLQQGVDFITLSFVRKASDVARVRQIMAQAGKRVPVVAKIERAEALEDLPAILAQADVIMVARGDLGVEMPAEEVPIIQKQIIEAANEAGVPVITATQMLESMIHHPRPTRAEVSDVANAIIDGSDAIMLSAETAIGEYPLEAVQMMSRIAEVAETSGRHGDWVQQRRWRVPATPGPARSIAAAARTLAEEETVAAICVFTLSGETARWIANQRPGVPIIAFTPSQATFRKMSLYWGVLPRMAAFSTDQDVLLDIMRPVVHQVVGPEAMSVLLIGGHPLAAGASTNFIKIQSLKPEP